jgi:hypothetical protein
VSFADAQDFMRAMKEMQGMALRDPMPHALCCILRLLIQYNALQANTLATVL